jgi:hypothetical protein
MPNAYTCTGLHSKRNIAFLPPKQSHQNHSRKKTQEAQKPRTRSRSFLRLLRFFAAITFDRVRRPCTSRQRQH